MLLIQPTEEMSKQIRVELNENVATRDKDVEVIKEWLSKQPHLPEFDGNRVRTILFVNVMDWHIQRFVLSSIFNIDVFNGKSQVVERKTEDIIEKS